ncbi:MAG: winged helix-turn-helix transcriptional regulator [Rhodocyclaceae bacterium]|nr:winged helix-turn-helix transcriptional regulator [Rhodocyclaceae bacterium]
MTVYSSSQPAIEPGDGPDPLSLLIRFRVLIRAAQRHSQWIERQSGITGAQLWALQELADDPGLRVGELAKRMALHQSTASNMVDKLATLDLLRRERGSADQRVVRLYPTPEGLALLARAPSPSRGVLLEALRAMDPQSRSQLEFALDALVDRMRDMDAGFGMQPMSFMEGTG